MNAYIGSLTRSTLPLEYKLIGYQPEQWTNLKTALFLKYMSFDLAAHESDFEMTNAQSFFTQHDFDLLFPSIQDSLDPIIPKGTPFLEPAVHPVAPSNAEAVYFNHKKEPVAVEEITQPDPSNGSNNWAVAPAKTKNGAPILCSDPHLGLNLPSLWYEMQLSVPGSNAYGVSFPGAPGIIIGFNDSCAFGFTNGGRDVRDYYEIQFKDASKKEYWFDSAWVPTTRRIERIKVAGAPDYIDTVAYTVFGPVMYDASFSGKRNTGGKNYAVRWTAHDKSNELRLFYMLDHAKNYQDYLAATPYLRTPGQNCVFACKNGDIAMRTEGKFPAKWKGQGDFVMPGFDSSYMWQGMIPENETPYQYNPERGFVSSANQRPVDSTYPYYLGREYPSSRGIMVNRKLASMQSITPQDMMQMQTNNYNVFAEMATPIFTQHIQTAQLNATQMRYVNLLQQWDFNNNYHSKGATVFAVAWKCLKDTVYNDEYAQAPEGTARPLESTLMEALLKDSTYPFIDLVQTPQKESLTDIVTIAFQTAVDSLVILEKSGKLEWGKCKDTYVGHLLKIPAFSRLHLPIGGGSNVINATKENHGPSWRMVISLTPQTEAYGVYPGGQSGNPGSKYYDSYIDQWASGQYYALWMMTPAEQNNARVKWKMRFNKL